MGSQTFTLLPEVVNVLSTPWKQAGAVVVEDGAYAYVDIAQSAQSGTIYLVGLKPSIAGSFSAATAIESVTVRVKRWASLLNAIKDLTLRLVQAGTPIGNNLADTTNFWTDTMATASYGGGVAVWGAFPTLADMAAGNFQLHFQVQNSGVVGQATAYVDAIEVEVVLTWPDPPVTAPPTVAPTPGQTPTGTTSPNVVDPGVNTPQVNQSSDLLSDLVQAAASSAAVALLSASLVAGESLKKTLVWLIEATGYNIETGLTETFYWSNTTSVIGYRIKSGHAAGPRMYHPVAKQPLEITYACFAAPDGVSGEVSASKGLCVLDNASGAFDAFRKLGSYHFVDQGIRVLVGTQDFDYTDFIEAFDGVIESVSVDEMNARIEISDRRKLVNASFQPLRYDGTGGIRGGDANVTDHVKPLGLGKVINATPKWIDATSRIAAFSSNFPSKAITQVRVDGVATTVTVTDLVNSTFTFSATPTGDVTVDFEGVEARNICKQSRTATDSSWQKINCTVELLAVGVDETASKGFKVTATSANAVLLPDELEAPYTLNYQGIVGSIYARRTSGVGTVVPFGSSDVIQLTTDWVRVFKTTLSFKTLTGVNIAVTGATKVYTRASGSFTTDGWVVGMFVLAIGFSNAANNGLSYVTTVGTTTMTVSNNRTMVDEASAAGRTLSTNCLQGIVIPNNGDVIEFDFFQCEPGLDLPSPPIEATTTVAKNHPNTFAAILKFVLTASAGMVPFLDFNEEQMAVLALKFDAEMHLWNDCREATVLQMVSKLCNSAPAFVLFDEDGLVYADRMALPETPPLIRLADNEILPTSEEIKFYPPVREVVVNYAENFTIQNLTGSVALANRERYRRQWLFVHDRDVAVEAITGTSANATMIVDTVLSVTADAAALNRHLLTVFKDKHAVFKVDNPLIALAARVGRPIRISGVPWTYARGEERAWRDGLVLFKSINAQQDRISLGVFV